MTSEIRCSLISSYWFLDFFSSSVFIAHVCSVQVFGGALGLLAVGKRADTHP